MSKTMKGGLVKGAVLLGLSSVLWPFGFASASPLSYDFGGADFGSSDWTLDGNALYAHDVFLTPPDRLRLTSGAIGQLGAAWLNTQQFNPQMDWSVSLRGQFSNRDPQGGGDGMALIWQTDGSSPAYDGAPIPYFVGGNLSGDYLAITLDSWYNWELPDPFAWQHNNLTVSTSTGVVGSLDLGLGALETNDLFNLSASYDDDTNTLSVVFDSDVLAPVSGNFNINLNTLFGANTSATVGFSARTGLAWENHDILEVSIDAAPGVSAVPEPGTVGLLGLGLAGLICVGRKRRYY